jgi:hypothetical protein
MSRPLGGLLLKYLGLLVVCCRNVAACWWSAEMSRPVGGLLLKCLGHLVVCC